MSPRVFCPALIVALCLAPAAAEAQLISQEQAMAHGLKRAWASQVQLDRSRDHLETLTLAGDALYAQTSRAVVHAFDAETGKTRWSRPIGSRDFPSLAVAGNDRFTAVVNGSSLYLLDALTARYRWERRLPGPPSAAAVMDDLNVYVMLLNGGMAVYELPEADEEPDAEPSDPWVIRGAHTPLSPVRVASPDAFVAWTTEGGLTYVCSMIDRRIVFEFRALDEIAASPAHRDPDFFVTSRDGSVYAFHQQTGAERWRFNAGYPVLEPPTVVGDAVLALPRGHGMFALSADDGRELWWTPEAKQFLAASPSRIYAADTFGRVLILNRQTGVRLDMMPTSRLNILPRNEANDRLYLANASGLVQCLREEGLDQPAPLNPVADEDEEKPAEDAAPAEEMPADAPAEPPADEFGDGLEVEAP